MIPFSKFKNIEPFFSYNNNLISKCRGVSKMATHKSTQPHISCRFINSKMVVWHETQVHSSVNGKLGSEPKIAQKLTLNLKHVMTLFRSLVSMAPNSNLMGYNFTTGWQTLNFRSCFTAHWFWFSTWCSRFNQGLTVSGSMPLLQ